MSDTREQITLFHMAEEVRSAARILAEAPTMVTDEPAWDLIVKVHPRFREQLVRMLDGYSNLLERR